MYCRSKRKIVHVDWGLNLINDIITVTNTMTVRGQTMKLMSRIKKVTAINVNINRAVAATIDVASIGMAILRILRIRAASVSPLICILKN